MDFNTKPKYIPSDLGITEYSYNIILNYLKNTKSIKYVWLHGSRAKEAARANSDIDFIIDTDLSSQGTIELDVNNLPVPYRIDFVNIRENNEKARNFLRRIIYTTKLVYRAEDFK